MSSSTIAKTISTFILKTFWPWFVKNVWPLIVKHMLKEIAAAIQSLTKSLKASIDRRMKTREDEALRRAATAEASAKLATTEAARAESEAIARVWREVAEQFRQENDALKSKLGQVTSKVVESAQSGVAVAAPALVELGGETTLVIAGESSTLPALPSPGGKN